MDVLGRAMSISFRPEFRDRAWVASALESGAGAGDFAGVGALALHAALAVTPLADLPAALAAAQERGGGPAAELASCVAALRAGGDLREECLRLAGVLSRAQ